MADNKTIDNGSLADFDIATDEIAGKDYQYVKLVSGTLDSTEKIEGTAANGLEVDVTRVTGTVTTTSTLAAGSAFAGKVQLTDGTSDATVRNLAANDALNVAIVDGSGAQVTSFGGSGGTSSTDNSAFTAGTTADTPIAGFYQSAPSAVTDGRSAAIGITVNREVKVSVTDSALDTDHDAPDAGRPVKTGAKAANALPAAVANADRTNNVSDLFGRLLVAHIDPAMQTWKSGNYTSTQTSTIVWDPAANKKIAVTHLQIDSYGTTAGRIIIYFGTGAYVEGTNQPVFKGKHSPSATSTPGALPPIGVHPLYSATADAELRITTDAAISLDVVVYGYEF